MKALHSLRRRLSVLLVAVVLLTGILTAVAAWVGAHVAAREEVLISLRRQAALTVALTADLPARTDRILQVLGEETTPAAWSPPGGELSGDPLARAADQALPAGNASGVVTISGREIAAVRRQLPSGGSLVLARQVRVSETGSGRFLSWVLIAVSGSALLGALAGAYAARHLAAPVRAAATTARRLAGGERDVRIATDGGPVELRELAEALNALGDALGRSEGRQREFLLSVSHELRTPLTAVKGYAESLADGLVMEPEDVRQAGRTVAAEAERLSRLVEDLMALARAGADRFEVEWRAVDIAAFLGDVSEVWGRRCTAVGVDFAVVIPEPVGVLHSDPVRLRQVLDNLLENALRVTPTGGRVEVTCVVDGPLRVEVADTGPGLSAQDRAVAFIGGALWARSRGVRQVGTGVGLALVKALAEALGGGVGVRPREGAGSVFWVELPVHPTGSEPWRRHEEGGGP